MIEITGKELDVSCGRITIGDGEAIKVNPGDVYVKVTGDGQKSNRQWIQRINEKACEMGTMKNVTISLLAVGASKPKKKDGE